MNPASMNPAGMNPAGMGQADRDQAGQEAFSIPALPAELLDRPLDYLAADHERHRAVCAFLKRVVREGAIRGASAGAVAGFLNKEFPLHLADEHDALYPALVKRSRDDEDFVAALQRIAAAQDAAVASLTPVVSGLKAVSALPAARLTPQLAQALDEYVREEEQRLAFENAVILRIADVRLRKSDIEAIRGDMKARRGVGGR